MNGANINELVMVCESLTLHYLQVHGGQISKTSELLLFLRRKCGRVGVPIACIPFFFKVV